MSSEPCQTSSYLEGDIKELYSIMTPLLEMLLEVENPETRLPTFNSRKTL